MYHCRKFVRSSFDLLARSEPDLRLHRANRSISPLFSSRSKVHSSFVVNLCVCPRIAACSGLLGVAFALPFHLIAMTPDFPASCPRRVLRSLSSTPHAKVTKPRACVSAVQCLSPFFGPAELWKNKSRRDYGTIPFKMHRSNLSPTKHMMKTLTPPPNPPPSLPPNPSRPPQNSPKHPLETPHYPSTPSPSASKPTNCPSPAKLWPDF